jgi:hypothetical protein
MASPLSANERRYLTWVSQAVRTNPFAESRAELDAKIAGMDGPSGGSRETEGGMVDRAIGKVSAPIEKFERQKRADTVRYFELCFQLRRAFFFIQKNLVGRSPCMQKLRASLWNNVFTHQIDWYDRYLWNRMADFSTLILGPTGAGKGTAAMAIGRSGYVPFDSAKGCFAESFMRSFTALNLSQFSPTLIESDCRRSPGAG